MAGGEGYKSYNPPNIHIMFGMKITATKNSMIQKLRADYVSVFVTACIALYIWVCRHFCNIAYYDAIDKFKV